MKFTQNQLLDWRDYEEVRWSGEFNMDTYQGRKATGLTKEKYKFVKDNYIELKEKALTTIQTATTNNKFFKLK